MQKQELAKLEYLLSEGASLALAAERAGVTLGEAVKHLRSYKVCREVTPEMLSLVADRAIQKGIQSLMVLADSMIPMLRLEATKELIRFGLEAKKIGIKLSQETIDATPQQLTHVKSQWKFPKIE